jgi:putative transcriptional regulator
MDRCITRRVDFLGHQPVDLGAEAIVENRLKVYRAMHDLTQAELAQKLDVTRATINAIENQRYDPSLKLAFQIAIFFNVRIEDIFIFKGKEVAKQAPILRELTGSLEQKGSLEDFQDYLMKKYLSSGHDGG